MLGVELQNPGSQVRFSPRRYTGEGGSIQLARVSTGLAQAGHGLWWKRKESCRGPDGLGIKMIPSLLSMIKTTALLIPLILRPYYVPGIVRKASSLH